MINDFDLSIDYDQNMQELTITTGIYDTVTYTDVITFKDIIDAISDYIKKELKERGL